MDRRRFLQSSIAAGGAFATSIPRFASASVLPPLAQEHSFTLDYAPSLGQFSALAGNDPVDQIAFMAEQGFAGLEDNGMRDRSVQEQTRIGEALQEHDLRMGVFVAHSIDWEAPSLTTGDPGPRKQFLDEIRESVEVAQRVHATWMTVVPGIRDPRHDDGYQTAHLVDTLRAATEILEPHDLVMVLEPLNTRRDHPGQFLTHTAQAYQICRAVDHDACKILYDAYHQQITEGNLIPSLDAAWNEIAYLQVADHPGRNEPTTGEINYRNVFKHLHEKGYDGLIGMEHGTAGEGRAGEQAVIDAYAQCDSFDT